MMVISVSPKIPEFPSSVKILDTSFQILMIEDKAKDSLCGSMEDAERIITINSELPYEVQVETFYHEVVHAALALTGIGMVLEDKIEEAVCQALGVALSSLVKNNKLPGAKND